MASARAAAARESPRSTPRPSASWRAAEARALCILLWWDTEVVDRRPHTGRTGDGRPRRWCAGTGAWLRYRCNLMLGITAAMIGGAQAGPAAGLQLGAVGDADPAGLGARASAAEARSTIRMACIPADWLPLKQLQAMPQGRRRRTGGSTGNRRAAARADRVASKGDWAGPTLASPLPGRTGPLAADGAAGRCGPRASPMEPALRRAARRWLANWRALKACWRLGGWRRERRGAVPRLHRSQRCGVRRAVDVATGAYWRRAGSSAAGVASCEAPRRVFIEASGAAGGAQSTWRLARIGSVLAARRLASRAARRRAVSSSKPAVRHAARRRRGDWRVLEACWRLGGWRREMRGAAPRLPQSQRRGWRRAVDSATGACD